MGREDESAVGGGGAEGFMPLMGALSNRHQSNSGQRHVAAMVAIDETANLHVNGLFAQFNPPWAAI